MTDMAMFDFFLILFAQEKSHRKKAKASANVVKWESFLLQSGGVVLN